MNNSVRVKARAMRRFIQIVRPTSSVAIVVLVAAPTLGASSQQLIEAVQKTDVAAVRALLEQPGVDLNETQPDGATALHWAAHRNSADLVEMLVEAGADTNATNEYGVTPLSLAAQNGGLAALEHLIKAGANIDGALPSGETPLMTAARVGAGDLVKSLLDHGADVNLAEQLKGQTALMWALSEQHLDVARLLVERGANVRAASSGGFTPLLFAARMGNLEAVKMLLAAGSNIEEEASNGGTPLLVATLRGHAALAMYFLDHGADANTTKAGFTPLHWAAGNWETQTTHDYPMRSASGRRWAGSRRDGSSSSLHSSPTAPTSTHESSRAHLDSGSTCSCRSRWLAARRSGSRLSAPTSRSCASSRRAARIRARGLMTTAHP